MIAPYLKVPHYGALPLYIPLFVLSVTCKIFIFLKLCYLRRQTLSSVPGPKWASWTRFWIIRVLASGNCAEKFVDINKHYGSLARIGPKHLLTSDPALIHRILAVRSDYTRGPWFDSLRIDPHSPNVVSERNEENHRRLRYKLSACYKSESVNAMEPMIDEQIMNWIYRAKTDWISEPSRARPFDIGKRIQFLTVDIITKICLGTALGCVASDSDKYNFLDTVERGSSVCQYFSVLLEFNSLLYYLTKIPVLGPRLIPQASDASGIGRIMGIVRSAIDQHTPASTNNDSGMLGSFLEKGVPRVDAEMAVTLVAGADTTSTALQSTLLAIISNPQVYQNLKEEIRTAVHSNIVSFPIQDMEAKRLGYLQACIFEGLRKFPPIGQLRERIVPPEGDEIQGHRIPGGTFIGINAWGTQLDEAYGDDPEIFRPERWLIKDQSQLRAMFQTHELIFSYGSSKCLGMPIAMMELSKMIFELLRHFDIAIANPYKPWTSLCYGIFFQKDFNVYLNQAKWDVNP